MTEKTVTAGISDKPVNAFAIRVENLAKRFNREWIFRKLNFTFEAGTTYAITGPNGSGKSTLMQILWGQMPPSNGTVSYEKSGKPLDSESVFRSVSIATPYMELIDEFTLTEQLRFHFAIKECRNAMTVNDLLDAMYLKEAKNKPIANFSSGMKQRVKLALALFTKADVIFLDEPGTNLDKTAFDWYLHQLEHLPIECLIFIASNQPSEYPSNAIKLDIMRYK